MLMPEAFSKIVELLLAKGFKSIKDLPACAEIEIDERWWVAVNGHPEQTKCSKGTEVPPFTAYIEFNGWPAGCIDPGGGCMAAGAIANEDELIAAIEAALSKETVKE